MRKLNKNKFKCEICKGVFYKGRSDEEAEAEHKRKFPTIPIEETGTICEDCYQIIMKDIKENPWKYPQLPE